MEASTTTRPGDQAQTALDERVIEDAELEKLLGDRQLAHGTKSEATSKFNSLDRLAKDKLEALGVEVEEPVRVGRFRVERRPVASRSVNFETAPTSRLNIKPVEED
jgi:hypothetical protein